MADIPINQSPGVPDPIRTGQVPGHGAGSSPTSKSDGVAFKALLDKLEEKARALEEQTRGVDDAANLAGAVEGAKASLDDALSLGEELLESFRQSRQQGNVPEEDPSR